MKKIGDITNTADKNGEFTDGNVAAGTPPTQLMGAWFNSVQREILNVLAKAGIPQSATKEDQLAEAITKMVASAGYLPADYSYSKLESDNKYQLKGNYAPAGNYATSEALKSGLDNKLDKTGGIVTGNLNVTGGYVQSVALEMQRGNVNEKAILYPPLSDNELAYFQYNNGASWFGKVEIPKISGGTSRLMLRGDYGWGGSGESTTLNERDLVSYYKNSSNISRVFRNNADSTLYHYKYSTVAYFRTADTYSAFSADYSGKGVIAIGGNNNTFYEYYLLHNRNTTIDRNGNLKASGAADHLSDCRVGCPLPWPQSTPPTGYLICNGQSFNKTTFPLLALAYPSGVLPDLRGEFIRGLDAGRNVDSGRTALSVQSDENKEHTHSMVLKSGSGNGSSEQASIRTLAVSVNDATYITQKSGGKESRPRNIAFLYIVRAA